MNKQYTESAKKKNEQKNGMCSVQTKGKIIIKTVSQITTQSAAKRAGKASKK